MADIAFLLIVFFVVTTVRTLDRTPLDLPDSRIRVQVDRHAAMIVLARGDPNAPGPLYRFSDGTSTSVEVSGPDSIAARAAEVIARTPDKAFEIKADGDLPCEDVGDVLDALSDAGARKVLLLTEPLDERGRRKP